MTTGAASIAACCLPARRAQTRSTPPPLRRRMVIEQQCPVVVMLTPVAEGAKAKCWAYFAEKAGGSKTFAAGDATFRVDTQ